LSKTTYRISELRAGYSQIDIVKPDKSTHLIAGLRMREEAETWVEAQKHKQAGDGTSFLFGEHRRVRSKDGQARPHPAAPQPIAPGASHFAVERHRQR
jgi:hypothetical protein